MSTGDAETTVDLRFDLQEAFNAFQANPEYTFTSEGKVKFARAQMQLDITVRLDEIVLQLKISSQQQTLQDAREPGVFVLTERKMMLE